MNFLALFENRWCACGTMFKDLLEEVSQGEGEERASAATWPDFRNVCQLMATAVRVVKTSFVSAGRAVFFFSVVAAPAGLAPPPRPAPVAAPPPAPPAAPRPPPP